MASVAEQNRVSLHQGNIVGYDLKPSKGFSTLSLNVITFVKILMSLLALITY